MILFISINGKEADTAVNLSKVLSIEKRDITAKIFVIYICPNLRDDCYTLRFDSKEERDNKFDEYITAWEMALKGDRKHD